MSELNLKSMTALLKHVYGPTIWHWDNGYNVYCPHDHCEVCFEQYGPELPPHWFTIEVQHKVPVSDPDWDPYSIWFTPKKYHARSWKDALSFVRKEKSLATDGFRYRGGWRGWLL